MLGFVEGCALGELVDELEGETSQILLIYVDLFFEVHAVSSSLLAQLRATFESKCLRRKLACCLTGAVENCMSAHLPLGMQSKG